MKNIAVVFGGFSSEYEVSVKSGKFIHDNLKDNPNLNVYQVCISKESNYVTYNNNRFDFDYDQIVSVGEFLATKIMSTYLDKIGFKNSLLDARDLICTNNTHLEHLL